MSGSIFGCHSLEDAIDIWWVEDRDAAKHPTCTDSRPNRECQGAEGDTPELQRRICWPWGLWGGAMTSTRSSGKAGVGCEPVCSPDAPFEACLSSLWHFNLSSFPRVSL